MDITFNFTGKLFQPEIYDRIIKTLESNVTSPIVIEFDITSYCNQLCEECISQTLLNKGEIPCSQILDLLDIFKELGIKAIVFTGGGEPLLHSSMSKPLLYAKKTGFDLGLVSNGILLKKYTNDLLDTLSWLRISVDSGNPETYSLLHYGTTAYSDIFYKIIEGMQSFAKKKVKTKLGFSFLISSHFENTCGYSNISEIYDACVLAKDIGCDYFEIKPKANKNHYLQLNSKKELYIIKKQYNKCKALADNDFRVFCSESLQDYLDKGLHFNDEYFVQNKTYTDCLVSKFRTTVTREGIFPCPYFRGDMNRGSQLNLAESYLSSYDFQNYLNSIYERIDPSRECKWYCIRHKQNLTLKFLFNNINERSQLSKENHKSQDCDFFI